jgi:hypothetical protein
MSPVTARYDTVLQLRTIKNHKVESANPLGRYFKWLALDDVVLDLAIRCNYVLNLARLVFARRRYLELPLNCFRYFLNREFVALDAGSSVNTAREVDL